MDLPEDYREGGFFVLRSGDRQYRVPRHCPHRGGRLDFGDVNHRHGTLVCPLHRSVFRLKDGRQLGGPECGPLAICEIKEGQ